MIDEKLQEFAEKLIIESGTETIRLAEIFDFKNEYEVLGQNFNSCLQEARRRAAYLIVVEDYNQDEFLAAADSFSSAREDTGYVEYDCIQSKIDARLMLLAWMRIRREAREFLSE